MYAMYLSVLLSTAHKYLQKIKSVPPAQPVACVALIRALLLAPLKGVLRIQSLILECYQFA